MCGICISGYAESGQFGCVLSDPCSAGLHNCEKPEYCINHAVGEFRCECPPGFIGNGRQCAGDPDLDGVPNTLLTVGCTSPPCAVVSASNVSTVQPYTGFIANLNKYKISILYSQKYYCVVWKLCNVCAMHM